MNDNSYLLIGGDERQEYLFEILNKENKKVEKIFLTDTENIQEAYKEIEKSNIIILPVPFSKDGETLYAPLFKKKVLLNSIIDKITKESVIFSGGENDVIKKSKAKKVINLLSNEALTLKNAMATAEATLSIMIENTKKTIFGSNIIIFGYGRIAKILLNYLTALKANVTVCARKESALTDANLSGAKTLKTNSFKTALQNFDTIINTIPAQILNIEELKAVRKNALIIDLASKPGGVDFDYAKNMGLNAIHALALPGKYSPLSAAEFIEQVINDEIT